MDTAEHIFSQIRIGHPGGYTRKVSHPFFMEEHACDRLVSTMFLKVGIDGFVILFVFQIRAAILCLHKAQGFRYKRSDKRCILHQHPGIAVLKLVPMLVRIHEVDAFR